MNKKIIVAMLSCAMAFSAILSANAAGSEQLAGRTIYKQTVEDTSFAKDLENGTYLITAQGTASASVRMGEEFYPSDKTGTVSFTADVTNGKLELTLSDDIHTIELCPFIKFDFGADPADGYISVSAQDNYTKNIGYGFNKPNAVKNVTASGTGALADAVEFIEFGASSDNTFNVDVPNGRYIVTVTAGDIQRMSIACEGYFTLMNMTGNNASASFEVDVTDGQLNLLATEGKAGTPFQISEIEIAKMPDYRNSRKTVFVGGDSTVTAYYPLAVNKLEPTVQGGWGQMLAQYIPSDFYISNYATGGQFAKGFLTSGQFDAVEHFMKPGDYFIVAFGINDNNPNYTTEEEYIQSMTEMVQRIKQKGGIPILVTAQGRLGDWNSDDVFYKPDRWFKPATKKIAQEQDIHFVDLHDVSSAYFTKIGKSATTALYWINWEGKQDTLHINREGASHCARLLTEELINQGFEEFDGMVYPYGLSDNILFKIFPISLDASTKAPAIQNLAPYDVSIPVIGVNYDKTTNRLSNVKPLTIKLDAYDALNPMSCSLLMTEQEENSYTKLYIMSDGELLPIDSDKMTHEYEIPAETAKALYTNYIVPAVSGQ